MRLNKLSLVLGMSMIILVARYPLHALEKSDGINWVSIYGSSGTSTITGTCDSINDVERLVDNNVIAAGTFETTNGSNNSYVLRIDEDSNPEWVDTLENSETATSEGYMITGTLSNNDLYFTGVTSYGKQDVL